MSAIPSVNDCKTPLLVSIRVGALSPLAGCSLPARGFCLLLRRLASAPGPWARTWPDGLAPGFTRVRGPALDLEACAPALPRWPGLLSSPAGMASAPGPWARTWPDGLAPGFTRVRGPALGLEACAPALPHWPRGYGSTLNLDSTLSLHYAVFRFQK